ncbi:MAG: T9SS type A sorting domain-containing protein [Flavobacterium sp.]
MKTKLFALVLFCTFQLGFSQNLISNPDFELGSIPATLGQITAATGWSQPCTDAYMYTSGGAGADLMDRNSTNASIKVPLNNFGNLNERTGDNRYAHLWQTENAFTGPGGAAELKGERITGTLTQTLNAGCYNVCLWAAIAPNSLTILDKGKQIIEVLLVSGNSCNGLLLFETPAISNVWNQYCKDFTLSSAQSGIYDRILFRIKNDGVANGNQFSVYIDETSLINTTPTVTISGNTQFCAGQSTTLTASSGYTNYLWSNGATTPSITVNTAGTYTVTAWNAGSTCQANSSTTVNVIALPKIILPDTYAICNSNFQSICGPSNTSLFNFTYSWYFNDTVAQTSTLVSHNQCFTPTQYGSYTLIVTNQYGCTSTKTITIVQGTGPAISIANVKYCGKTPLYIGFPAAYADAVSYQWTYNSGTPFIGGYKVNNMGDGQYCVTVTWNTGCTSTTCFTVEECCTPITEFTISYNPFGSTANITVQNNTANTPYYDAEQFILYQDCGNGWIQYSSVSRSSNFDLPVMFTGLNEDCTYKVVHSVTSYCLHKSFTSEEFAYGKLAVTFYPNPVRIGEPVILEITSISKESTIEIVDLDSGELIYKKTVPNDKPIQIENEVFTKNSKSASGVYNVKVSDETGVVNKKLIVQ